MANLKVVFVLDHRCVLSQAESFPTEFIVCCEFGNRCRGYSWFWSFLVKVLKVFLWGGDGCVWVVRCRSFSLFMSSSLVDFFFLCFHFYREDVMAKRLSQEKCHQVA